MKRLLVIRNIFRGMLLISLLFRLFFVEKLSYSWNVISYVFLAIGLVGMIVLEIVVYSKKKSK
jgi:hypothetical protein